MKRIAVFLLSLEVLLGAFFIAGYKTEPVGIHQTQAAMAKQIAAEPPGDYYIGRRYYKMYFKIWGYVRPPPQPWSTAKLVMLTEKQKLSPDRARLSFGSDNKYEDRLCGYFPGQTVYEPASNGFYPEFVLTGYKVLSNNPARIFRDPGATDPNGLYIDKPE